MKLLEGTAVIVAALTLAGCGGDTPAGSSTAPAQAASSSTAAPTKDLRAICPEVEALLGDSPTPSKKQLAALRSAVVDLRDSADLEAQNALGPFITALDDSSAAYDSGELLPKLGVQEEYDRGVGALAVRCKAVGSSSFQ